MEPMIQRLRSFVIKERDGVAAIEFGLLAPSFFMLMIAIFEISYYVYMTTASQRAIEKAMYDLRTGHAYTVMNQQDWTIEEWYTESICERVTLPACESSLSIEIEQYDGNFDVFWNSNDAGALTAGTAGILMRVEVVFQLPEIVFTSLIFGDSATQLKTGLTFMTEPYN